MLQTDENHEIVLDIDIRLLRTNQAAPLESNSLKYISTTTHTIVTSQLYLQKYVSTFQSTLN